MFLFTGIENPGLDIQASSQAPFAIGLPFTPTVGCRIDFSSVPIEALTPCSMLNRQLVFSPVTKPAELTPKRSNLSIISEEAVDISKELESYQLELENSMNEAKATKKRGNKNLMDLKQKDSFAKRLHEAIENAFVEKPSTSENIELVEMAKTGEQHSCHDSSDGHSDCPKSSTPKTPNENCIAKYQLDNTMNVNPDIVYEEIDDSRLDEPHDESKQSQKKTPEAEDEDAELFKNPAPFVRTYRRDMRRPTAPANSTNNEPSAEHKPKDTKSDEKTKDNEIFGGIRSSIRKSIRKLMHPNATKAKSTDDIVSGNVSNEKQAPSAPTNILNTIRHSLRRKQPKQPLATSTPCESLNDVSIIDAKPRPIFKDAALSNKAAEDVNEDIGIVRAKNNIRSSFRKSSRNVMKTVFKKNIENYALEK